ncbi:DUF2599 domain-containing protein [Pseudomonas sp. HN11]|uniref:DUF2599 domain-containing protein n=1 Tax=Pseudomonas sp. HN11 TaxID=1344094 RepID=UPI001F1711C7|nr:DUF2599 domain-containing protein [Pseudomonas sp. HN11]UII72351.1 DUF2599 domain-containing protein [Pseudomonas sp. HN11]
MSNKGKRTTGTLLLVCVLAMSSTCVNASPGTDAATMMRYLYNFTARDCGNGRLASECSGLMLRGIASKQSYLPWDPSPYSHSLEVGGFGPPNLSNRGVSVSYLRTDTSYDGLGLNKFNGFALKPNDFVDPKTEFKLKVLCAFPIDSWTGNRTDAGCGDYQENLNTLEAVEDYCQKLGVSNASAWLEHFHRQPTQPSLKSHKYQCGFDTVNNYFGTYNKADAFNTFVEARKLLANDAADKVDAQVTQTELRLLTWPDNKYWNRDWGATRPQFDAPLDPSLEVNKTYKQLPIIAFIYVSRVGVIHSDGRVFEARELARDDQRRWLEQGNAWKPIVHLEMPKNSGEDARFTYISADQSPVAPEPVDPRSCDKYIESVEWTDNYVEPVMGIIASLKVTPTECGRKAGVGKTDVVYAELANLAANDMSKPWNFDHLGSSMRRQLGCHLDSPFIAANKESWSLEPARPYVPHDVIMKLEGNSLCNPNSVNTKA